MAFKKRVTVPTDDLKVGETVVLKGEPWEVIAINTVSGVKVQRNGRVASTTTVKEWTVLRAAEPTERIDTRDNPPVGSEAHARSEYEVRPPTVDTRDLITTQDYLKAVGMPDDQLEGSARTFGTVLMRLYRQRYGKDAKPAKKLEYVHYLDVNGMEAQRSNAEAPVHLRVKPNGWYESNAFEEKDLDMFEEVRSHRHPGLAPYVDPCQRAVDVLREEFGVDPAELSGKLGSELVWMAEQQIQQCLNSGIVCGHESCARRRSKTSKRISVRDEEMDWS